MRKIFLITALLALSCRTAGPKGADSPGGGTDSPGTDSRDTSTETSGGFCAIQDIFDADCVLCHSAGGQAGGLDLQTDAHRALVGVSSASYAGRTLVISGDSANSFLSVKLSGAQTAAEGDLMPDPAADKAGCGCASSSANGGGLFAGLFAAALAFVGRRRRN